MSLVASTSVAEALLALKIAFLILLYLFVIRVIRSAGRERDRMRCPYRSPYLPSRATCPLAARTGRGRRTPYL